jgi:hypothetical protein
VHAESVTLVLRRHRRRRRRQVAWIRQAHDCREPSYPVTLRNVYGHTRSQSARTGLRRGPTAGRRIARLAALSAGLLQLLYATVAVAILVGGGPLDQDGGFTVRGTGSDRLANNIVHLAVTTPVITLIGWAAAALTGYLVRRRPSTAAPLAADPIQAT